ncbi:quinoprotein relay system zinc metallohydrolase 1 [uncultured Sphingomonas sp.]|uniref:quinoprotein relay system zinc metallohydrolase 1 n=1 Tax=uncultured Sphingomonas sp. TaxID=158754 RepID=UPI0025F33325|nr:quinoprotein relay system zinc metallohydrolase 1 [uncultured Sphingomonas sp.]
MRLTRRTLLGGMAALPVAARAQALDYRIEPVAVGDGLWMVRGSDEPIERGNGGAIANLAILAGDEAAILIDCGPSLRYGRALDAAVRKLTGKPVGHVFVTHLHPDHGFAAGAFANAEVAGTPDLRRELQATSAGYADGMYRLLGDWMRGTEPVLPAATVTVGERVVAGRRLAFAPMAGHSPADLVVTDMATGTMIAGDLVFHDRAPSTPDADPARWRQALGTLASMPHKGLLPGHGPFDPGGQAAIAQTLDWLDWLEGSLRASITAGLDMVAAGEVAIPARFDRVKAARYELQRSVSHFYPRLETELFPRADR